MQLITKEQKKEKKRRLRKKLIISSIIIITISLTIGHLLDDIIISLSGFLLSGIIARIHE